MATIWLRFLGEGGSKPKGYEFWLRFFCLFFQSQFYCCKLKEKWLRYGYDFFRGGGFESFWLRCGYDTKGEGGSTHFSGYVVFGQPLTRTGSLETSLLLYNITEYTGRQK